MVETCLGMFSPLLLATASPLLRLTLATASPLLRYTLATASPLLRLTLAAASPLLLANASHFPLLPVCMYVHAAAHLPV